jgi:hypothetical protein
VYHRTLNRFAEMEADAMVRQIAALPVLVTEELGSR